MSLLQHMIETDRLLLEPLRVEHAEQMFSGLANINLYENLPEEPPATLHELRKRFQFLVAGADPSGNEEWLNYVLVGKKTRLPIGYTQATIRTNAPCLIAYLIFQPHWRRGYGSEAVSASVDHIFSHFNIDSIDAYIDTRNVASHGLVSKLGFQYFEKIKDADFFKGSSSDEYRYSMTRDAWQPRT